MRPKQDEQNKAQLQKIEALQRLKKDYKEVFQTEAGQRVLDDLLFRAHLWETTFTGNSKSYFLEGKRDLGLYIFKMINAADPNIIANFIYHNARLKKQRDG